MARQFFVEDENIVKISDDTFEITSSEIKHIQVLRYNVEDEITINNKLYKIISMGRKSIVVKHIKDLINKEGSSIEITLYIAILKNEMMDLCIKKSVELGIKKLQPFFSDNVIVKFTKQGDILKRKEKFERIVKEAVKQCGRPDLPDICDFCTLGQLKQSMESNDINILAYEKETKSLKETITKIKKDNSNINKIGIIIGPEGGFRDEEIEKIKKFKNTFSISLGNRILRAETAALNLISIVTYEFEK